MDAPERYRLLWHPAWKRPWRIFDTSDERLIFTFPDNRYALAERVLRRLNTPPEELEEAA